MKISLASDHAGFELKEDIKKYLAEKNIEVQDFGPPDEGSVDYPDYAQKVGDAVASGKTERGILICGTGIGMMISANKIKGVYAALVDNTFTAEMCRKHNSANVLVMPGRMIAKALAREITNIWLKTEFEAGRHAARYEKIKALENKNFK